MLFPDQSDQQALLPDSTETAQRLSSFSSFKTQQQIPWVAHAVTLAEGGYLQVLVLLSSLLWTTARLHNRRYVKRVRPTHKYSAIRWPWELCAHVARTAALAFLALATARGQTHWLNAACGTYAMVFGLLRLINDLEWRHIALHQVNLVLTVAFLTVTASALLPCVEAHEQCSISGLMKGALSGLGASIVIALTTPREWVPPSLTHKMPKGVSEEEPAPEEICSWAVYYLTYDWLTPLIWKGARRQVTIADLPKLAWYDDPLLLLSRIKKARAKGKTTFWTLFRLLRTELATMAVCIGTAYTVELVAPFALYNLLTYLADPEAATVRPWVWLSLMFFGPLSRSVFFQQYVFTSTRLIVRVKSSMTQALYRRAMSSMELEDDVFATPVAANKPAAGKPAAAQATSSAGGRLANLMAADVDAVFGARDVIMICVGVPTGTTVAVIGLYNMLGWPSLLGAAVLMLTSPVSVYIAQLMGRATRRVRRAQDSRISLVAEYLTSIRAVKYFAWENAVAGKIQEARASEQRELWRLSVFYVILNQFTQLIPFIALFLMFSLYVAVQKQTLTAATAFTTVFLVKNIRKNLTQAGSLSKRATAALVAIDRLDKYFSTTVPVQKFPEGPLRVENASFRRNKTASFELNDISIDFVQGGLNTVTGPSGSGKTTLLLALLGETYRDGGVVTRPRNVAFSSQSTWLQNDSIKNNILFYSSFEQARYDRVLEACSLLLDLSQMEQGDQTVVGENGASLSGGQKARVALARALYSKAPLLLLDDVFSALDSKTSATVWERCFCTDLLKDRTVVLVAQQPWVAAQADLSVTLENGEVVHTQQNIGVLRRPVVSSDHSSEGTTVDEPAEVSGDGRADPLNNVAKTATEHKKKDDVSQEMKASGKSARLMFFRYMTYFGSPLYAVLCIVVMVFTNIAWLGGSLWLSVWVEAYSKEEAVNIAFYLGIYAAFAFAETTSNAALILAFENGSWQAARRLHNDLVRAVMSVPLSWFKDVPVGRVVNRFSRDMYSIDSAVSGQLQRFLDNGLTIFFRIGAISSILPVFMLPAAVTCFVGVCVGEMYTRTAVTVKKLVSSAQSPVFTQFSDTLAGLAVIRAREGMPVVFGEDLAERLRVWSRAAEANYNCNRWVAMRVDFITALVSLCAGIIAVSKAGVVAAGLVGFSLTNATGLSTTILSLVRSMNDLEIELQSFVRVREYSGLEPEGKSDKTYAEEGEFTDDERHVIPHSWPSTGKIEFRNVTIRYDPEGPDILTKVNLSFRAGERVAVVGRTGSGKSTLVLSMLRFTHIVEGQILYDGIDITRIPRRRLREGLTIIPQEAVLFNGTVESNLDPTETVPWERLQDALVYCEDIASFQHQSDNDQASRSRGVSPNGATTPQQPNEGITLDTHVAPNGENFSHGQRQVLSLCRALVRKSPLMLLDEATASMDYETDQGIQKILRQEMNEAGGDRTLVTIAHRLRTIIDYDTVVVMGGGKVVESGSPRELFERKGVFHEMVHHSGEGDDLVKSLRR